LYCFTCLQLASGPIIGSEAGMPNTEV
jgi:hypothetical protein